MWVLVIFALGTGASGTAHHIPDFKTKQECVDAANWVNGISHSYRSDWLATCVRRSK